MELRRRIDPLPRKDLCTKEYRTSTRSSQVMPRSRCIWTPRTLQNLRNRSKELLVARNVHIRQELRRRLRHMPRNEEHYTPNQRTTPTDGDPQSTIRDYHHGLYHRPPHLERIRLHPRLHRQVHHNHYPFTLQQRRRCVKNCRHAHEQCFPILRNTKEDHLRSRTPIRFPS